MILTYTAAGVVWLVLHGVLQGMAVGAIVRHTGALNGAMTAAKAEWAKATRNA